MGRKTIAENFTKKDIEFIKTTFLNKKLLYDKRIKIISDKYCVSTRMVRRWLAKFKINPKAETKENPDYKAAQKRKINKKNKVFIFTWAQNDTPIHKKLLENIEAYAKFRCADIHVILGRYKNTTSVFADQPYDVWVPEILKYKDANRHKLHKHLTILSDVKIQPTAFNPLSGMEGFSGLSSCVVGSPKVHLKPVAAFEGHRPKLMLTTGAITEKNYTDSKAGKKGEFHHTFGFVIVEIKDSETFFIRQVTATNDGNFCDFIYKVKDTKVTRIEKIDIAYLGDIHCGQTCEKVNATQRTWLDKLKPKHTIIPDVFDGYSITHHEEDDPIKMHHKFLEGKCDLQVEIDLMMQWLESMKKYNLVIQASNHNDFVDRWVKRVNWKYHIVNATQYIEYAQILLSGKAPNGIIAHLIAEKFGKDIKILSRHEKFMFNGWELSNHGDMGVNGARGSAAGYRKLNVKMINGHSHTPLREDGVLYVGTSTKLRVGYNIGASSWMNADVITHKDGKAQHLIYTNGEFTTIKF